MHVSSVLCGIEAPSGANTSGGAKVLEGAGVVLRLFFFGWCFDYFFLGGASIIFFFGWCFDYFFFGWCFDYFFLGGASIFFWVVLQFFLGGASIFLGGASIFFFEIFRFF